MNNPKENKKNYLISLLKKYWEYDKDVNRENLDNDSIDKMYDILVIKDEKKREELLNSYKEEEIKKMNEKYKKAQELLAKVKRLSIQLRESKSDLADKKDIENLEDQILIS